jgi:hypothetical protein
LATHLLVSVRSFNRIAMSTVSVLQVAATAMLSALRKYLPPALKDLPAPTVSIVKLKQQAVGLGGIRSGEMPGALGSVTRKGLRLDALTRFQMWAPDGNRVDQTIADLNMWVLGNRPSLWASGFLRLALEDAPLSEPVAPGGPWRGLADYRVLYEFDYQDNDGADSLISQIPIAINSEFNESLVITDQMTRWDDSAATSLVVRGPMAVASLSMLAFIPKAVPTAQVTLTRTFDRAAGNPVNHATLAEFLAAISGANLERHSMVTFASFGEFMAEFQNKGASIALGDWNGDGVTDQYESFALSLNPAVTLPTVRDRFEVTYLAAKFNQVAVVYLRAMSG